MGSFGGSGGRPGSFDSNGDRAGGNAGAGSPLPGAAGFPAGAGFSGRKGELLSAPGRGRTVLPPGEAAAGGTSAGNRSARGVEEPLLFRGAIVSLGGGSHSSPGGVGTISAPTDWGKVFSGRACPGQVRHRGVKYPKSFALGVQTHPSLQPGETITSDRPHCVHHSRTPKDTNPHDRSLLPLIVFFHPQAI
jgi:hypothetical protein